MRDHQERGQVAAELPRYQSHKRVWALKIKAISLAPDGGAVITPEEKGYAPIRVDASYFSKHQPDVGGYYVVYPDGYRSWSPAKAFEDGYVALNESDERERPERTAEHTIGWAVKQMHNGDRVRRAGWNGKGMFLFLVPGSRFSVNRPPLLGIYPEGTEIDYHPHVDMKTAQGYVVPWLCSQADLLAADWEIAE